MTADQRLRYIREMREWIAYVHTEWPGHKRVPKHMRVAVMSHARYAATGPHFTTEDD